jgi:hypothetical protein
VELSATSGAPIRNERTGRSAVTNGKRLHVVQLPKGHATAWQRRFRDVLNEIISDLGGKEGRSEGERQLARRCATIAIECEKLEFVAASGDEIDVDRYGALTDRLGRCFQRLGLKRQQREVSWRDKWLSDTEAESAAPVEVESSASDDATVVEVPPESDRT